jgi:hypothetical protein
MTDRVTAPKAAPSAMGTQAKIGSRPHREANSRLIAELLEALRAAGYECDLAVVGAEPN